MAGSWIDIKGKDGTFGAYLALPPTGKGPGIVLFQEIFGVNRHIRACADQYALDGYVVIAPDMFWRQKPRLELGYTPDEIHDHLDKAASVQCPIQFHYAEKDAMIPLDPAVESVKQAFAGKPAEVHVYRNADHGFNCWERGTYYQPAAALAHGRTLQFFATHLSQA